MGRGASEQCQSAAMPAVVGCDTVLSLEEKVRLAGDWTLMVQASGSFRYRVDTKPTNWNPALGVPEGFG